jgi:pimeloyl-ACP methyl ester carboxylesterase
MRLHCVEAGDGPLVLLLHGFPEHWHSWRHQLPALAAAGYRAVAVDLPGYNHSDKPTGLAAYAPRALATTAAELIGALGHKSAAVIGHDWGGGVAWFASAYHPELVSRLVIMGAPHPMRMAAWLRTPRGARAELHGVIAQIPLVSERLFAARDCAFLRKRFFEPAARATGGESDVETYTAAMRQPGAVRAAAAYYRASGRNRKDALLAGIRIEQPLLLLWGEHDRFVPRHLAEPDERFLPNARLELVADSDHWVAQEHPQEVNRRLVAFLGGD